MSSPPVLKTELEKIWLQDDIVWLVKRLGFAEVDERTDWPQVIEVLPEFADVLQQAVQDAARETTEVQLLSHGIEGRAVARRDGLRRFLVWDLLGTPKSEDGPCGALAIIALMSCHSAPWLWCWICESAEEDEYAQSIFGWWEPQRFAFAKGFPLFAQRID
ncbi:MAG: hypothetical protein F4W96_10925 [Chloroflexi bacterium]|nr:hypothetical protein [Chloroflexota bacterium]